MWGVREAAADLDQAFGTDGIASVEVADDPGADDEPAPIITQADGKIVLATRDADNFAIFRFDSDGTLDPGFGTDGKRVVSLGGEDRPVDLAIQSDGRIVVLGISSFQGTDRLGLIRLEPTGALDTSFGTGGIVTEYVEDATSPHAMVLQHDGKILVVGQKGGFLWSGAFVARFEASGAIDDSFGQDGVVFTSAGLSGDALYAVALQPDAKIVGVGFAFLGGDYGSWLIVRFLPDGAPDETFGVEGEVQLGFPPALAPLSVISQALAVLVQADGKIVAAGSTGATYLQWPSDFASARYDSSGQLDDTYGDGGVSQIAPLGGSFSIAYPTAILSSAEGRLTMVGPASAETSYPSRSALVLRTSDDGSLDTSWSEDGVVELADVGLWTEGGLTVDGAEGPGGAIIVSTRSGGKVELRRVTGLIDCGNGLLDPGESCDDANSTDGDCCSSLCQIESSTQECRPSARVCDVPEFCDGQSPTCPPDQNMADGTACSDGKVCTQGDICLEGACKPGDCDEGKSCGVCGGVGECTQLAGGQCGCLL